MATKDISIEEMTAIADTQLEEIALIITESSLPFTEGVHVQMLIDRSIGNSNKGSKRWVSKLISHNTESYKQNVQTLLHQQAYLDNPSIRLYSTLNSRNMASAITAFKHRMVDVSACRIGSEPAFYLDVQNNFISALMKPENRATKYFLIDIDSQEGERLSRIESFLENQNIPVLWKKETVKGWHYITLPFRTSLLEHFEWVDVKKDGLLLLMADTKERGDK